MPVQQNRNCNNQPKWQQNMYKQGIDGFELKPLGALLTLGYLAIFLAKVQQAQQLPRTRRCPLPHNRLEVGRPS